MMLYIEINLILQNYIGLEIWINSEILFWFLYIGNSGNLNLIAKNIFQFIELIIANRIFLNKKYIYFFRYYLDQNIETIYKKIWCRKICSLNFILNK